MSDTQKERVWLALSKAAERIASREYAAGHYKPTRRGGKVVQGYRLSEAHQTVLDAMNALGRDEITPEEAMAVLHEHDVMQARTGRTATKRKRSYTSRSKSSRGKKRRTLTRLRHAGSAKRQGYGVMRSGHQARYSRVPQQNSYVVGPYSEYGPAHEKALRIESAGGRGMRIDKRRGGWYVSYVSSKLLH